MNKPLIKYMVFLFIAAFAFSGCGDENEGTDNNWYNNGPFSFANGVTFLLSDPLARIHAEVLVGADGIVMAGSNWNVTGVGGEGGIAAGDVLKIPGTPGYGYAYTSGSFFIPGQAPQQVQYGHILLQFRYDSDPGPITTEDKYIQVSGKVDQTAHFICDRDLRVVRFNVRTSHLDEVFQTWTITAPIRFDRVTIEDYHAFDGCR